MFPALVHRSCWLIPGTWAFKSSVRTSERSYHIWIAVTQFINGYMCADMRASHLLDDCIRKIIFCEQWGNSPSWCDEGPVRLCLGARKGCKKVKLSRGQFRELFLRWTEFKWYCGTYLDYFKIWYLIKLKNKHLLVAHPHICRYTNLVKSSFILNFSTTVTGSSFTIQQDALQGKYSKKPSSLPPSFQFTISNTSNQH